MGRRGVLLVALLGMAGTVGACGDTRNDAFHAPPQFVTELRLEEDGTLLRPIRLEYRADTLYVSYRGVSRIDRFDAGLQPLGGIHLGKGHGIHASDFAVTDTGVAVCDHSLGSILLVDRQGDYVGSFGLLPDGETRLSPLAMDAFRGVAYVADVAQRRILAVSLTDSEVTDRGELILSIPKPVPEGSR